MFNLPQTFESKLQLDSADEMYDFGVRLGQQFKAGDTVILVGELGAGKTTFARGVGEGIGVRGQVSSPTFVIARHHPSVSVGPDLIHVDAYRLSGREEFDDLDLPFEKAVVLVEWGAGVAESKAGWLEIHIERKTGEDFAELDFEASDEPRKVTIRGFGERFGERFSDGVKI